MPPAPSVARAPIVSTVVISAASLTCPALAGPCGCSSPSAVFSARGLIVRAASSPSASWDLLVPTPVPPIASARPTTRSVALSVARPAARLAIRLTMTTSLDTLLRRVKQLKDEAVLPPRFVGIDDWAWRKGRRYGTIVVDLEKSEVVDLLPDRDAETVKKWLKSHPGVELVTRDRSGAYGLAVAEAAPQARQVVDRWHLLKNRREAIERLFERQSAVVGAALKSAESVTLLASKSTSDRLMKASPTDEASPSQEPIEPSLEPPRLQARRAGRQRRVERFEQVHERRRQKHSVRRIARELGMSRNAVRRYLRCATCPDWNPGRSRRSRLDKHREWIDAQLTEGEPNAIELHRRLRNGLPGLLWQCAAIRHETSGRCRQETRPRQRGQGSVGTLAVSKATVVRVGSSASGPQTRRTGSP